ncbi:MAG: hypothetical protein ACHQWH_01185 [Nitrososphaerales archaeon]|jgi:hypothetical protein
MEKQEPSKTSREEEEKNQALALRYHNDIIGTEYLGKYGVGLVTDSKKFVRLMEKSVLDNLLRREEQIAKQTKVSEASKKNNGKSKSNKLGDVVI